MMITQKERSLGGNSRAGFGGLLSGLMDAGGGFCVRIDGVVIWTVRCWGRKRLASAMVGGVGTNDGCRVEVGLAFPPKSSIIVTLKPTKVTECVIFPIAIVVPHYGDCRQDNMWM